MDDTVWIGNQDDGTVTSIDTQYSGRTSTYAIGHQIIRSRRPATVKSWCS